MCGITGFWQYKETNEEMLTNAIIRMSETVAHRGPDDSGVYVDGKSGIALGHRRLSILDVTSLGHQPMESASGRYLIVYNGEIYNFKEIRSELDGRNIQWKGHSDTEVLLAAIEVWGLTAALARVNGMFAFALWDRKERVLWLCRDRLGIKPLYYAKTGKGIVFGSELKTIKAHPDFDTEIDRNVLALYLRHNYVPAPYTIYKNTWKLRPGNILSVSVDDLQAGKELQRPHCYWDAKAIAEKGQNNSFQGTTDAVIERLDSLLRDSVKRRMVSDGSVGAFLSGGIDSSLVVALMQAQSSSPVRTFSIGLEEQGYNEATYAKEIAHYLGTDHTELYISPKEAMEVIPLLPMLYDEPFSDSSQIPTFLVSQLAKRYVTASLSGDGGDELFGGYKRYFVANAIWNKVGWMPKNVRNLVARFVSSITVDVLNNRFTWLSPALSKYGRPGLPGDKLHKLAEILFAETPDTIYRRLVSHWKNPASLVIDAAEPPTVLTDVSRWADLPDIKQCMMYLDLVTYLPDDGLVKVHGASMGAGLVVRVPILDHRVVEFAWSLPLSMKVRSGQGKWILRQVLNKYVPRELMERPKLGFGIPIDSWLRGPLRDWAETLIDEAKLQQEGFFNPVPIRQKWAEHLLGKRNWAYHLWDVLMFQVWLESIK